MLAALVFVVAAVLAAIVEGLNAARWRGRAERLEQSIQGHRFTSLDALRIERSRAIFGDLGIVILRDADRVEVFTIPNASINRPHGTFQMTGKVLGRPFAQRLAAALIDHADYSQLGDLPTPAAGFRLRRGEATMDLIFESSGSHLDIGVTVRDEGVSVVHESRWWTCVNDEAFGPLVKDALSE